MVVISYRSIREFVIKYRDSEDALNNWFTIMEKADFANFNEIKS